MELKHDWQSFQLLFYSARRNLASETLAKNAMGPIRVVTSGVGGPGGETVVSAYADGEEFSEWIGASCIELATAFPHREVYAYDHRVIEGWLQESVGVTHFYGQNEFLLSKAGTLQIFKAPRGNKPPKGEAVNLVQTGKTHFLLEALQGGWARVFPSSYGVFVRLEGEVLEDFIVTVRRGKIEGFQRPDLSSMGRERSRQPAEVVRYLSEKFLVPVQGVFVSAQEWKTWSASSRPWKKVSGAVRQGQAKLVPFRPLLAGMMVVKALMGG
ncbi:hypothetical protein WDW86_21990 [Bdellovibrionota bacterium FG-2]